MIYSESEGENKSLASPNQLLLLCETFFLGEA
jgi:hypothetical protein